MKKHYTLAFLLVLIFQSSYSQNHRSLQFINYVFSTDSLKGFDEASAKASAIAEDFLGQEFEVRMYTLKRIFINNKYNLTRHHPVAKILAPAQQISPACINEDFEASAAGPIIIANQINGWTCEASNTYPPYNSCNPAPFGATVESELINCPAATGYIDPFIGGVYPIYSVFGSVPNTGNALNPQLTAPMGGTKVLHINGWSGNYSIERISKTFSVTSGNALFQFAYIAFFATGHNCCDAASFKIEVLDVNTGSVLTCPSFSLAAPGVQCSTVTPIPYYIPPAATVYTGSGSYVFNKWHITSLDLSPYIGTSIKINVVASDCNAGGHFGNAYFDAQCSPVTIEMNGNAFPAGNPTLAINSCGANNMTVTAPPGLGPYSWSSGQIVVPANLSIPNHTNTTLITNQSGTVQLTMDGIGCTSITKTISINITPAPIPVTISGNTAICIGNVAVLTASNANTYTWSTNSNANSIMVSPMSTSVYAVSGTDANYCSSSASFTVVVNPLPVLGVSGPYSVCVGSGGSYTFTGASSYSVDGIPVSNPAIVIPPNTMDYTLTGELNTCINTQTFNVEVDPSCSNVWPGDANSDGIANNLDVLELGLHIGSSGTQRPLLSNAWLSFYASNWVGTITNGKNVVHANCNGDNIINPTDTIPIWLNYNSTHQFRGENTFTTSPEIHLQADQPFVTNSQWGSVSVYLGDNASPVNLNGAAFTLDFENDYIQPDSIGLHYPVSFLNANNQNINFRKIFFANEKVHAATTHTTNTNVSGNGKIATLYFKIKEFVGADTVIKIKAVKAFRSVIGNPLSSLTTGSTTVIIKATDVGIKENFKNNKIAIYPNPASDQLTIEFNTPTAGITVYNHLGQIVKEETLIFKDQKAYLSVNELPTGVYLVGIKNKEEGTLTTRFVIAR